MIETPIVIREAVRDDSKPIADLSGLLGYPSTAGETFSRLALVIDHSQLSVCTS